MYCAVRYVGSAAFATLSRHLRSASKHTLIKNTTPEARPSERGPTTVRNIPCVII